MKHYKQILDENGNYRLDENYTEILRLDKMLTEADIPHTLDRFNDGWQVIYTVNGERIADAVQHFGSYGENENLLEIMGLVKPEETSDSVLGYLTAEDVFNRMREHYRALKTELKPCPFCGGEARFVSNVSPYSNKPACLVTCKKCGAQTKNFVAKDNTFSYKDEAQNAWNTRTLQNEDVRKDKGNGT